MQSIETQPLEPVIAAAQHVGQWHRCVFSGGAEGVDKVRARPVDIGGEIKIQLTHFNGTQTRDENLDPEQWPDALQRLTAGAFDHIHLASSTQDWHARRTRKGRWLVSRGKPSMPAGKAASPGHDRARQYPLPGDRPDPLLQALGIQDTTGRLRATRRDKFKQINHFLRILNDALDPDTLPTDRPIELIDAGCGHAYLTCAAWHHLNRLYPGRVRLTGVDREPERIRHCNEVRAALGDPPHLTFIEQSIGDFVPEVAPTAVLSLHACDTATDEALALAVRWQAEVILCAPCCQHELREQLDNAVLRPVLRHGILKQRVAEILTDACRAHLLRLCGYRVDLLEFIDSRHTPKNLLIRARLTGHPPDASLLEEYRQLQAQWRVEPALRRLLADRLDPLLAS
ncbi:MAG: SAM-dependent methyltransferase [Opitutales bacterium]